MPQYSIPVDILNPGEVFACLGFMESAEILFGYVEGGFDWGGGSNTQFKLFISQDSNPFEKVLEFLAYAERESIYPHEGVFPSGDVKEKERPCLLERDGYSIIVSHWTDGSTRKNFKLFAGNQDPIKTIIPHLQEGIKDLLEQNRNYLVNDPYDQMYPVGRKSWNMDARSAWTARDVGYSLEIQKQEIMTSPVVELLAAIGLEHARPKVDSTNRDSVRYGVWEGLAPTILARAVLGCSNVGIPMRVFQFTLNKSGSHGEYKQVSFAREIIEQR